MSIQIKVIDEEQEESKLFREYCKKAFKVDEYFGLVISNLLSYPKIVTDSSIKEITLTKITLDEEAVSILSIGIQRNIYIKAINLSCKQKLL